MHAPKVKIIIHAAQHVRRLSGGSQAQLIVASDQSLWAVKFQNNPQHGRVLLNEMFGTKLAAALGLSVPETTVIKVDKSFIEKNPEMTFDVEGARIMCMPGLHFGSRYLEGTSPGSVSSYLLESELPKVENLFEFCGALAFDKWTENNDGRQVLFVRDAQEARYHVYFIDQGDCFRGGQKFSDCQYRGVYPRNNVYLSVTSMYSFEPWIARIKAIDRSYLWRLASQIPPVWYGNDLAILDSLVDRLLERRTFVQDLIFAFAESPRNPFPNWIRSRS